MSEKVEIRTELILAGVEKNNRDLAEMKAKFDQGDKARETAQKGFGEWAATASHLANVLGVNLSSVVAKFRDMGGELLGMGASAESGDQAVAALIATAQGAKVTDAVEQAGMYGDALDEIAVRAGVAGDAVGGAFQAMLEVTGATEQGIVRATNQVTDLAIVSAKLGKNTEAIAREYSFMGEGVLKTKGQLFQLLQTTGIFGKDTKKAAEGWQALTEEKRAELLAQGLGQLASRMREMPPTFKQAQASFENMVRIGKEEFAQPLVEELSPAIEDATRELLAMRPEVADLGRALAKELAPDIRGGARAIKEALGWVRDHKAEIADDLREAAQHVRDAFGFVLAHKEEIALAFGAKTAMPVLKPAAGLVADVYGAGKGGAGGGFAGLASGGVGAGVASVAALTAAVVALGLAADQTRKLVSELQDTEDTRLGGMRRLQQLADAGDVENVENAARTMAQLDEAAGRMTPQLRRFYETTVDGARRSKQMSEDAGEQLRKQIALGAAGSSNADAMRGGAAGGKTGEDVANYAMNQEAILLNAYNQAMQAGNKQMALMAAQTIASGALVGDAFLKTAKDVEGGFEAMADMLLASGGQFAGFASQLKGKSATPPPPKIVMTGGQTFNVKQDFRDKDPDKIAVAFRRDVGRTVERRASARYSGPFGS